MNEFDIDIPDHQDAVIEVYNSIKRNEPFWRNWLELRTSDLAEEFPEDERVAALALITSLQNLAYVVGDK